MSGHALFSWTRNNRRQQSIPEHRRSRGTAAATFPGADEHPRGGTGPECGSARVFRDAQKVMGTAKVRRHPVNNPNGAENHVL